MTLLDQPPYQAYAYAYPHKTAYGPLEPRPLAEVWADEPTDAVFLYAHVPYCEMRCGFCNLFTTTRTDREEHDAYLDALERQARAVSAALGPVTVAQVAIGGGTPTLLAPDQLHRLFDLLESVFGVDLADVPVGIETSPLTATADRLAALRARGVTRVSMGVQSFVEAEVRASGRPQRTADVVRALDALAASGIGTRNVDLIYGQAGQTPESWADSLDRALSWSPEEVFLYPLYVRPLTGLGRRGRTVEDWDAMRLELYRQGRDHLLARGYTQHSMRMFRRGPATPTAYRCQEDGMIGLGAGARSYTRHLHYATEWGIGRRRVGSILDAFHARSAADHATADHGVVLDDAERQRRHLVQSLLCREGLDRAWFAERFGVDPVAEYPWLTELVDRGLATLDDVEMRLTDAGLERSDAIGPWLTSPAMQARMAAYELR
jgi:oxygen-independent coproporphyrinogen-3 oxidase